MDLNLPTEESAFRDELRAVACVQRPEGLERMARKAYRGILSVPARPGNGSCRKAAGPRFRGPGNMGAAAPH